MLMKWVKALPPHGSACFSGSVCTGRADLLRSVEWLPWSCYMNGHSSTEMVLPFPPCRPMNFGSHSLLNTGMVSQGQECLPAIKPCVLQLHLIHLLTLHSTLSGRSHRSCFKRSEVSGFKTSIQLRWFPFLSCIQSCRIRVTPINSCWDWNMVKGSKNT